MKDLRTVIGEKLAFYMKRQEVSAAQLAEYAGVSRNAIYAILGGKSYPRLRTIVSIAERLCVTPVDLLEDKYE